MTDRGLVLYLGLLPLFAHQGRTEGKKRGVRAAASGRGQDPLLSQESPQSKDGRALRPTSYKGGRAEKEPRPTVWPTLGDFLGTRQLERT